MKKFILLISLLIFSSTLNAQKLFNGCWDMPSYDAQGEMTAYYGLRLRQEGNIISGKHLICMHDGNLIDEFDNSNSITGTAQDSVAIINIRTSRCFQLTRAIGKAKLEIIEGDSLRFTLLTAPHTREHLFADTIVLPRYIKEEAQEAQEAQEDQD